MKKNFLIYGASSQISIELIKLLEDKCENLYLFCRKSSTFKINFKKNSKVKVKYFYSDLLDKKRNLFLFKKIKTKLDGVFWIAGNTGNANVEQKKTSIAEMSLKINFMHPLYLINELIKKLRKNNQSFLVYVASVAGLRGRGKNLFYGSSKAGMISYLSGLRQLFNNKLKIITIIPGYISTKKFKITAPSFLISSPRFVAKKIIFAINKHQEVVYVSFIWRLIMLIIRLIPEKIFKKLNF